MQDPSTMVENTDFSPEEITEEESGISQFQLMKRQFLRNKLAVAGLIVISICFIVYVFFPGFFAVNRYTSIQEDYMFAAPQVPQFFDEEGNFHIRPFTYGLESELNMETLTWEYSLDMSEKHSIYFINRDHENDYKLLGFIPTNIRLMGIESSDPWYPFGADRMGRCVYSRILHGGRISLTVGLVGVILTVLLGTVLGTISGYFGGLVDTMIQRLIELLLSFPAIPLWAALAAAVPPEWTSVQTFFMISIILSLRNWVGLGRQIRGKVMSYREEEYTLAAESAGASGFYIVRKHMIPNALSHVIVVATLSIPGMILAETALSFLGLGIQPPMVSWGTLLQTAQRVDVVLSHQWLMIPGFAVVVAVLAYNFLGDGIRDAADPFST